MKTLAQLDPDLAEGGKGLWLELSYWPNFGLLCFERADWLMRYASVGASLESAPIGQL